MSSEDLLAKAEEVAKKNPFLVLVGAGCLTPNQVPVGATKELGLTNQEEKDAKIIAVLKRENPKEYQAFFFRVLKEFFEKEKKNMKTEWGRDHYSKIGISLVEKLMKGAIKKEEVKILRVEFGGAEYACLKPKDKVGDYDYVVAIMASNRWFCQELGYSDLTIYVLSEKYLRLAQRFARAYEKKTGKKAEIHKEY